MESMDYEVRDRRHERDGGKTSEKSKKTGN
jgi:hypothetical protein